MLIKAIETHGRDWTKVIDDLNKVVPSKPYQTIVGHAIKLAKLYEQDPEKALFVEKMSKNSKQKTGLTN